MLPAEYGVMVASLPRGGDMDDASPPNRAAQAVDGLERGFLALSEADGSGAPDRLVLVGNSYGALLAYEMAHRLARRAIAVERLVVSGFRSPVLPCSDAPLHRLPRQRLFAELAARFGGNAGPGADWAADMVEPALRADLEACDTYRHAHGDKLAAPITVLHMRADSSVSLDELQAWQAVTAASAHIEHHDLGHFPWATHPGAVADILLRLVRAFGDGPGASGRSAFILPETTIDDERGWV